MAPPTATETCTIELQEYDHIARLPQAAGQSRNSPASSKTQIPNLPDGGYILSSPRKSGEIGPNDEEITDPSLRSNATPDETLPEGTVAIPALQTWNNPPINKWRILAAFYGFIVMGEYL